MSVTIPTPLGGVPSTVTSGSSTVSVVVAGGQVYALDPAGAGVLSPPVGPVQPAGVTTFIYNVFSSHPSGNIASSTASPSPTLVSSNSPTTSFSSEASLSSDQSAIASKTSSPSETSQQSSASGAAASSTSSNHSSVVSRTSLIATAAVLGALLALALIALLFFIFRKRSTLRLPFSYHSRTF